MKYYFNIESNKKKDGTRVCYGKSGRVFVLSGKHGAWQATANHYTEGLVHVIFAASLDEISDKLTKV